MEKGNILLSHKLQRPEGQWNRKQKTDLIDSLLRKYPINPTYGIKEDGVISVIDGVQRLSCVRDFISDKFALSKDMEPVIINGEEKSLAGLKFNKLDEDTKDIILNSELQLYELSDCTEQDVREMFRRQNAGKALNSTQLRTTFTSDEMLDVIYSLTSHVFFDKVLSPTQKRKDLGKDLIVETLMLIETNAENDYTSFKSKNINDFIIMYQEDINYDKIEILKQAMDKLDESFEEMNIKQLNVPMILFVSYRCIKDKKSFTKLKEIIEQFISDYNNPERLQEYKQFCQSSTSSPECVRGRLDYWRNIIREL